MTDALEIAKYLVCRPDIPLGGPINDGAGGEYIGWMSSCGHPTKVAGENLESGWRLRENGDYVCWGRPGMADSDCIVLNEWVFQATIIDLIAAALRKI